MRSRHTTSYTTKRHRTRDGRALLIAADRAVVQVPVLVSALGLEGLPVRKLRFTPKEMRWGEVALGPVPAGFDAAELARWEEEAPAACDQICRLRAQRD